MLCIHSLYSLLMDVLMDILKHCGRTLTPLSSVLNVLAVSAPSVDEHGNSDTVHCAAEESCDWLYVSPV